MLASANKPNTSGSRQAGFTVPELIFALIALFVMLTVAGFLLRSQNYQQARYEAEMRLNIATIMQAINRYQADHNGALPEGISEQYAFIGTQDKQVDLCKVLVPQYLKDMPLDSLTGAKAYKPADENEAVPEERNQQACNMPNMVYMSGYTIVKDKEGSVHLAVLDADLETPVLTLSQK
jgi:type II secretory pathway pseudopilin PulG